MTKKEEGKSRLFMDNSMFGIRQGPQQEKKMLQRGRKWSFEAKWEIQKAENTRGQVGAFGGPCVDSDPSVWEQNTLK